MMTSTRRSFLRALVVAPLAAVVGVSAPVLWKKKLWFFAHGDMKSGRVFWTPCAPAAEIIRTEFGSVVKWNPLPPWSATGTVPSRGHDGRHT